MQKPGTAAAVFLFPLLLIALVSFGVYFNALFNGFVYDDHSQVLKNTLIRDIRNIPEIFRSNVWTFEGAPPTSNYYRPMLNLFYMFNYYVFGLQAWGFHLVNILFHAGNSVLVFLIMSRLLDGFTTRTDGGAPLLLSSPLIAALLFAAHPIHVEAVTWIAGLSDVSFAFFYLLSFYLYVRSRGSYRWQYVFSVLFFFLAVLCKEPGLTLPVLLIAYDHAFGNRPVWRFAQMMRYAAFLLVAAFYFVIRFRVLGGFTPLQRLAKLSAAEQIINVFPLFGQYLQKLLLPINLNFWPVFNPITSLVSVEGILSVCLAMIFAGALVLALKKDKMVFFSLVLVVAPLAPALYLKGVIGKPFADRYLYLPSVGFAMLTAYFFSWAKAHHQGAARLLPFVLALVLASYAWGTVSRNKVWKDEYSLFEDTVKKSPDSVVPRLEFGNALLARGMFDEAIAQYQVARRMEPRLYVIYHHLGLAFAGEDRLSEAIEQYILALALNPNSAEIHSDLGRAYAKAGFRSGAVREFRIAVEIQPTAANHNVLGIAYAQNKEINKAVEEFMTATALDPAQADYRRNLAEALELKRAFKKGRTAVFSGDYGERSVKNSEMFKFAW